MSSEDALKTMKDPADGSRPTPPPQSEKNWATGEVIQDVANHGYANNYGSESKSDQPLDEEAKSKTEANVQSVKGENFEQVAEPDNLSQSFAGNTGVITLTQSFNREKGEASVQPRFTRVKTSTLVWVSLAISISTLLIVAFILGRVVTPSPPTSELASSAMPVVITSTQNLASDVAEEIRLLRVEIQTLRAQIASLEKSQVTANEIQALRDQVAALTKSQISTDEIKALVVQSTNSTKPPTSPEWPTILLIIVFAIACLVFAGYVFTHPSTNTETDSKAKLAARVALISAIVAGILIPVSQNLSSLVPTPVWPCAVHPSWCGFVDQGTPSPSSSGTVTMTVTPDATPISGTFVAPTATFSPTPIPTASPTIQLTSTPLVGLTPNQLETPSLGTPSVPVIINNYIYPDQCCIPTCRTKSKAPCLTPTLDP